MADMKKYVAVLLLGGAVIILTSGIAYGYWTDKLELKLEIPLVYRLEVTVIEPEADGSDIQVDLDGHDDGMSEKSSLNDHSSEAVDSTDGEGDAASEGGREGAEEG